MTSLRSRLTVSYASLVSVVLIIVAVVLTRFAFSFLTQSTFSAVAQSVAAANAIVAARPHDDPAAVAEAVRNAARRPGVVAFIMRDDGRRTPPPDSPVTNSAQQLSLGTLLGFRPHFIAIAGGKARVLIAPDLRQLEPVVRVYLESLVVSVLLAIALAWLIARWITDLAIAPLITVTGELRRFASGDFTPRPVASNDRSELGELIAAYNGATAQVAAAFAERVRIEEQMRRFVADAGHELRTPLTVVSAFVDVLERGGADDPGIRERAFRTLRTETRRMRRLVERLMALARLERPDATTAEPVDVAAIADGAVAEVLAARRGDVSLTVDSGETQVLGDRGELHEAIGNLVDNAVKYGAGSPVTVDVRRDGGDVVVRVRDGGPGIPERERAHVFERFFRGGQTTGIEGSGLGLAIVQRAAERCGGTVRLEDAGAAGTTFAMVLPHLNGNHS